MKGLLGLAVTTILFAPSSGWGQELDQQQGPAGTRDGVHLYEVSVSLGSSFFDGVTVNGSAAGGCNCYTLGSASAGYSHTGPINEFNVAYTPTFGDRFGSDGFHSFDQSLRFSYESRFAPKWTFSLTGSGNDSSVEQLLFLPSFSPSSVAPGASAADQLGAFVTTNLTPAEPSPTLLYGGRILNFGGRTALTYRPSSRLRISLGGGAYEAQTRKDGTATANTVIDIVPRSRYENVELDLGYSLTPLSEVGSESSTLVYHTVFGDFRTVVEQGSYARKLSPHWMTLVQGGIGTYTPLESNLRGAGATFTGGATVDYDSRSNSFLFGYSKQIGDVYGLGSSSTQGFQTTWKWRMPGRNWSTYVTLGRQRLTGGALIAAATNWQATVGVTRPLSEHLWMSLSYGYLMDALAPATVYNTLSANVVRLTLIFTPVIENQPPGAALN
jgi:hypothetical protein